MICVVNFADDKYAKNQKLNSLSAKYLGGADKVMSYSLNDIDDEFKARNNYILSQKRGSGLWLWKPYFILKTLYSMEEGDYLFYSDSGAVFIRKIKPLIESMNMCEVDLMVFEIPLLERQFTNSECLSRFSVSNTYENQILGGYLLLKKTKKNVQLMEEWLNLCAMPELFISQSETNEKSQNKDYISHREDQSILSLLCHKYNIMSFRDPSQYGIRPWEHMSVGRYYVEKEYKESRYSTLLVNCRNTNAIVAVIKFLLKNILYRTKILTKQKYMNKYNYSISKRHGKEYIDICQ